LLSEDLLEEIRRNLSKKIKLPLNTIDEIISLLKNQTQIAKPNKLSTRASRDSDDDAVLGLAIAVNANYIITGDEDLLSLKEFQKIPIVSPREFWDILKKVKQ
jgi:putative PIN family toxin of toxin-antitoxin system